MLTLIGCQHFMVAMQIFIVKSDVADVMVTSAVGITMLINKSSITQTDGVAFMSIQGTPYTGVDVCPQGKLSTTANFCFESRSYESQILH